MGRTGLAVLVALVAGCGGRSESASGSGQEGAAPVSPLVASLGSVEVRTEASGPEPVRLTNGEYTAPAAPGSAEQIIVRVLDKAAEGDLNGDGTPEIAALVGSSGGGTGVFVDLVIFARDGGTPRQVASTLIGDRIRPIGISVEGGMVQVELDQHSENDPMCCPAQRALRTFRLEGDSLVMVSATPPPYVAP